MSTTINTNYSQFYKGTERINNSGSASNKKDTVVRYGFNMTDEEGNKVMDKMSKEETFRTMNDISSQYGDNVIVEFSGDGLAAFEEHKGKIPLPEESVREIPEDMITYFDGPEPLSEEVLAEIKESQSRTKSGDEILDDMKHTSPDAYREYARLRNEREAKGTTDQIPEDAKFLMKWALKREFPNLSVPGMDDWKIDASNEDVRQTLSEKFENTDIFIGGLYGNDMSLFSDKDFSIFLSNDEAEILRSGSEEDKEKLLKLLDNNMKALSELKEKLAADDKANIFKFGVSFDDGDTISFMADGGGNTYSASTTEELLKVITSK